MLSEIATRQPIMSPQKPLSKTEIAVRNGRTVYINNVRQADPETMGKNEVVLKLSNNKKLGKQVTIGRLKGFPIYSLSLEERATCPTSCVHWADCYGNNMPFAHRYSAGEKLESMLESELDTLQKKHPDGFLVRLHVLGDFYSSKYVGKWSDWLNKFPALNIYGYTAYHPTATDPREREIGEAILALRATFGARFSVRFSGNYTDSDLTALSYDDPRAVTAVEQKRAFICPTQISKKTKKYVAPKEEALVPNCGACGLCWTTKKPVAFMTH